MIWQKILKVTVIPTKIVTIVIIVVIINYFWVPSTAQVFKTATSTKRKYTFIKCEVQCKE